MSIPVTSAIQQAIGQGNFSQAQRLLDDAQQQQPNQSLQRELHYLQAVVQRLQGQLAQALTTLNTLLAEHPDHARAYQELGYLYQAQRDEPHAAAAFYQATKRNPALLASWKHLLKVYQAQNNGPAVQVAKTQIDYLQSLPREILGARDLMYEGNLSAADQVCRRFLQNNKHHTDAMLLLGEIGIHLKVYGEAEFVLESCHQLNPNHLPVAMEYLKVLAKMGKFAVTRDVANTLLPLHPNHAPLRAALASALVGLGELDEAIRHYQHILHSNPDQPGIQLLLGHAYKAAGQFDRAIKAYRNAYDSREDFGDAYWSLANTKTYRFSDAEITQMEALAQRTDINKDDNIHLHFALGKAHEDRRNIDAAFAHYQRGNAMKLEESGYDPARTEQQIAAYKRFFTPELFTRFAGCGEPSPDPIFIVGLPRAGSTLLEQILASHSMVDGTMELHNILGLVSRLHGKSTPYPGILSDIPPDLLAKFGQQYLQETQVYRQGAPLFIDKMPNNFLHIGLIKLILPNAKIIDARREPMACCFSGFKQLFGEGQEFTYGLESIGRYYRAYIDLMNHWQQVLPDFVLKVQHEDVIDDLEGQVKRMLAFCGLPFEPACLTYYNTERAIKTPSSEQVRQPIFRSSMDQWKTFEAHLSPLKAQLSGLPEISA